MKIETLRPDWPAPPNVIAHSTLRDGGVSDGAWCSLNLGAHVGDDAAAVATNRARLTEQLCLPSEPHWLDQVHGTRVCTFDDTDCCADAAFSVRPEEVCVVMTADCLPVLLCNRSGSAVAAVHAGWRGLLAGVIEQAVMAFPGASSDVLAWLGPAIGPRAFEVGDEVRAAFVTEDEASARCFETHRADRYLADLYGLARGRLARVGVDAVYGGAYCTFNEPERFFSYRRDGITGRMAHLIWLAPGNASDSR